MTRAANPSPRRWLRFTLRGGFIVLTLLCVWLGIQVTKARKQARAVDRIEALGGFVMFEHQRAPGGDWHRTLGTPAPELLRGLIGDEFFRRADAVDLESNWHGLFHEVRTAPIDDDLAAIADLPDLTNVHLGHAMAITDKGLVHLSGLDGLTVVSLYGTRITGPGLAYLPLSLERVSLQDAPITDEGLVHLARLSKLRRLYLANTRITDEGLRHVARLPSLEVLDLMRTEVTDAGLVQLRPLTGLKTLSLHGTRVSGRGIRDLQAALPQCVIDPPPQDVDALPEEMQFWPDGHRPTQAEVVAMVSQFDGQADVDPTRPGQPIVRLWLHNTRMSDESMLRLMREMPYLEGLNLGHVLVGDELAKGLLELKRLESLSLVTSRLSDVGLAEIGKHGALRVLSIRDTRITDAGLPHLAGLKTLERLSAGNNRVTFDGLHKLQLALPKCEVSY